MAWRKWSDAAWVGCCDAPIKRPFLSRSLGCQIIGYYSISSVQSRYDSLAWIPTGVSLPPIDCTELLKCVYVYFCNAAEIAHFASCYAWHAQAHCIESHKRARFFSIATKNASCKMHIFLEYA